MTPPLGTIEQEAEACRAAWAAKPRARYGIHIHHETVVEELIEPIEARIAYILSDKPVDERALRLRLMRPVTASARSAYQEATASAQRAYQEAITSAGRAYDEATASARSAYQEATASAQRAYQEAHHLGLACLRRGHRLVSAQRAYREAKASAHAALCPTPDCPWDGRSIFTSIDSLASRGPSRSWRRATPSASPVGARTSW